MAANNVRSVLWRPTEKYSVNAIVPKYAAVKGSLGADSKCLA